MKTKTTVLERIAIAIASLALSIGAIALLSGFFAGRDPAGVSGIASGPGLAFVDMGHAQLRPGDRRPVYDSRPPTSGAHFPVPVTRQDVGLSVDQLLQALEVGNVVIVYGTSSPPPGLRTLARALAPPFTPALAAAGQAVILARRRGTTGLLGLAWAHALPASTPNAALRAFTAFWLGRGALGH